MIVRALRWNGQTASLSQMPEPVLAPGEALIRPRLVTLTKADLDAASAGRGECVLGRAFVGTVAEVSVPKDASPALAARGKLKGKRVVAEASVSCNRCDLCKAGLRNHCRQRAVLGQAGGRPGGLAELVAMPLMNLQAVPEGVDDELAVFADPVASAAHSAQLARVEGKPYITVLGDGRLGLLTVQVMAKLNASVRLLGKHPEKFGLCERWGIKHRHIDEVGRRADQDIVVDCTGSASGLALAMQLVRPRGKIILKSASDLRPGAAGAGAGGAGGANAAAGRGGADLSPLVVNEIELIGGRDGPIEAALAHLERGEVQVLPLISRRMKLSDGPAILDAARAAGAISVVVEIA